MNDYTDNEFKKNVSDYIKLLYPSISANINDLDIAYNELSNVLTLVGHPQDMKMREVLHTAYAEINVIKRSGRDYREWCIENEELYNKIKLFCIKLLEDPESVVDGI